MEILIYVLGWVLCGLLAVFVGGVADRYKAADAAPINLLFLCGPFGLLLATIVLATHFECSSSLLRRIYKAGLGND